MILKKRLTCLLLASMLFVGLSACGATPVLPEDAVVSPDGKFAVRADIRENLEDENGAFYSIYDVQLYDSIKKTMLCTFHIVGRDFHFFWSPDSTYIAAAYSGRTWSAFSLLDVRRHAEISIPGLSEIFDSLKNAGAKIDYACHQARPDPYVSPLEWSPDSTRLLVSYQVRDTGDKTQSGTFIFNLAEGIYTDLDQLPPSDADHAEVKKPENFSWN